MMILQNESKYIKLFSCCFVFRGVARSIICDTQRNIIKPIPNALYELISHFNYKTIGELVLNYGINNKQIVCEYLEFLLENEFVFFCKVEDLNNFPPIDIDTFLNPHKITNAICEIDEFNIDVFQKIISELNEVQCFAIEIRLLRKIDLSIIYSILQSFNNASVKEINLVIPDNDFSFDNLKPLFSAYFKLTKLIVANANENSYLSGFLTSASEIVFTDRMVNLSTCCGNFPKNYFHNNLQFIVESQRHNSCLNRKVSIDKDGNIKNCPALPTVYGNIHTNKLARTLDNAEFTLKWYINKNQIGVCRTCEFRYICMDCRAFLEDPADIYSKPLKCGYNPDTCEWEDWSTNPLKQMAKAHYNMNEVNI